MIYQIVMLPRRSLVAGFELVNVTLKFRFVIID